MSKHRVGMLASIIAAGVFSSAWQVALAQGAAAAGEVEEQLEEVIVTGTSIRGVAPVGSTPVVYGREEMRNDAPSNVGDVLANIPQIASFATEQQLSTTNRFRTSGFIPVIHNMDIGSTLTLFNGHRMAPTGTEATFADPSIIPTIALDRVEVVSDGNSAIYGSDAVAGVVNFLYRRDVDGFEVDLSTMQDPNTSYQNRNIGLLWGKTFDRGNVMIAFEHAKHDAALQGELPFVADADRRGLGGADRRPTNCNEPRVVNAGTTYSGPTLAAGAAAARCNPDTDLQLGFDNVRKSVLATGRFSPRDGLELTAELNYSEYEEPRFQNWDFISVAVPRTSPFFWVPPGGTTATTQTANVTSESIFGKRPQLATSKISALTLGAAFDVSATWRSSLRAHYSKTDDYWDALALDLVNLGTLAASGQFNPYAGAPVSVAGLNTTANSAAVIAQINNRSGVTNTGQQTLSEFEARMDGPLFAIGGGDVKAAVGLNYRSEALRQIQDAGCQTAGCSFYRRMRNDDFSRGTSAAFAEFAIPVVSDANARAGIRELTVSVAGRYDKYDRLDGQFTPKVAFNYRPTDTLSFQGSWGKSYAAPNIGLTTQTFSIVQLNMNIEGTNFNTYNLGGGNSDLESESAKTYSFGFNMKPTGALEGLKAGVSYYDVKYDNIIYKPGFPDLIFNSAFYGQRIVGNNATPLVPVAIPAATMAQIMAQYPPDRIVAATQVFHLVARTYAINMNSRTFAGLDYSLQYDWTNSAGRWGLGLNANQQTKRETQPVVNGAVSDDIDTFVAPVWQGRFQAQWAGNSIPLRLAWVANYRGSYGLRNTTWAYGGDSYLTHNLTLGYDFKNMTRLKGLSLQARVQNVTDADPPFADLVVGYDDDNHNPYGRQFTLSLHANF